MVIEHPEMGYRRLTYRLMDREEGHVAVSPLTTYNVLKRAGLMGVKPKEISKKGKGR